MVKVDFYNHVKKYLDEVSKCQIRSVEDIIEYNLDSAGSEGGLPGMVPGFPAGQERFYQSAATKGEEDETYHAALEFMQSSTRRGIDSALRNSGRAVDALLVPTDVQQAGSVAAQAQYPVITVPTGVNATRTGMPFGLMLMGTAWGESNLIRLASAVEDALRADGSQRPLPQWRDRQRRVVPVVNE